MTDELRCPRCGGTTFHESERGSESYDSYAFTVEVCRRCELEHYATWDDEPQWWIAYCGNDWNEAYDPVNPEHQWAAPAEGAPA